jgi:ketosteroid isomerase-like protein
MTDRRGIESTLSAYFDGINSERYNEVAALFAPETELRAPGTAPLRGRAEVEGYYRAALGPYPRHRDEPTRTLVSGRTATVEIRFTGELASGAPIEFDAVDVFDFDHQGQIVRLTSWYDSHDVRSRLRRARAAELSAIATEPGSDA